MRHYLTTILASLGVLVATSSCDPIHDCFDYISNLCTDNLNVRVELENVGGQPTNRIIVENLSPGLSEWTLEQLGTTDRISNRPCDTLVATHTGANEVKFRTYNDTRNEYVERTITIDVPTITTVPGYIADRLCIGQEGAPTGFSNEFDPAKVMAIPERDAQGRAGNRVKLINGNPCMVDWHFGKETSDKNIAELYVLQLGDNQLSATFTRADGTQFDYTFDPVRVETFTFKPQFVIDLTGEDGEKTWTWANDNFSFGLGGYGGEGGWGSGGPDYAQMDLTTLGYIGSALGIGDECATGAKMTFKVTGELTTGHRHGSYNFDLDAAIPGWRLGTLTTKDVTVLYGRQFGMDPSNPIGAECFEYDIVACDANKLVLCANMGGGMGTFFVFKPTKEVIKKKTEMEINLMGENGSKTWTWDSTDHGFGLGGYGGEGGWGSQGPDYAQLDLTTLSQIGSSLGIPNECKVGATMTFTDKGALITDDRKGSFTYDFSAVIEGWRKGTIHTSGVTVLYGRHFSMDPTNPVGAECFDYDIVECKPNRLVLCANQGGGMGTFFVFRPAK